LDRLDRFLDLLFLVTFGVIAWFAAERDGAGIFGMREFSMRTLPAARNLIKPGIL
jgi:hypothetical protein